MSIRPLVLTTLVSLVSLGGTAAVAQTELELQHFGSEKAPANTRTEVRAEVKRALASGELTTPTEVLAIELEPKATALALARRTKASAEVGR